MEVNTSNWSLGEETNKPVLELMGCEPWLPDYVTFFNSHSAVFALSPGLGAKDKRHSRQSVVYCKDAGKTNEV